jgi:hypothetical protein
MNMVISSAQCHGRFSVINTAESVLKTLLNTIHIYINNG